MKQSSHECMIDQYGYPIQQQRGISHINQLRRIFQSMVNLSVWGNVDHHPRKKPRYRDIYPSYTHSLIYTGRVIVRHNDDLIVDMTQTEAERPELPDSAVHAETLSSEALPSTIFGWNGPFIPWRVPTAFLETRGERVSVDHGVPDFLTAHGLEKWERYLSELKQVCAKIGTTTCK